MLDRSFNLNPLDTRGSVIQIYGEVNGVAWKRKPLYNSASYGFAINFFDSKGILFKIANSDADGSIRTKEALIARIKNILSKQE